jgi:hypothetical protein
MRTLTDGEREIVAELNADAADAEAWDCERDWLDDCDEPTPEELAALEPVVAALEAATFGGDVPEPWQLAPDQEPF